MKNVNVIQRSKMILMGLLAAVSSAAFANDNVLAEETFKATFSDYGLIDNVLKCTPGYRGFYPTADVVELQQHTVDLGYAVTDKVYRSYSKLGLENDPQNRRVGERRPYAEGCKLAIDKIKSEIAGKEVVELTIHRRVTQMSNAQNRATRKLNGDVLQVNLIQSLLVFESINFIFAGLEFGLGQFTNGAVISK